MVNHTQIIRRQHPAYCCVFDHFVSLALKWLKLDFETCNNYNAEKTVIEISQNLARISGVKILCSIFDKIKF